ncbi:MAG: hypothetical protein AAFZ65_08535 [Planctomycetota bacterium]
MILPTNKLGRAFFATDRAPRLWRVGWWVFYAACLWCVTLLVADLPPGTYVPPLIFAGLQTTLLLPALLVGLTVGIRSALKSREWIAVAPLMPWALTVVLAGGTLGTVGGNLPERVAFKLSEPGLNRLLAEAHALPPEVQYVVEEPRRIGLYLIDNVLKSPNGRVRLVVLGTRLGGVQHGLMWVGVETDLPVNPDYHIEPHGDIDPSGGGWYRFENEL